MRAVNRIMGSVLIGMGAVMGAVRQVSGLHLNGPRRLTPVRFSLRLVYFRARFDGALHRDIPVRISAKLQAAIWGVL